MWSDPRKAVFGVNVAFFALSWITVSLRVVVRVGMLRAFGSDDWTMLAALLFFTAYLIAQLGGVVYGTGEHLDELVPWRAETALHYWYFCELFYALSTSVLKISVGLFLLRVATKPVHVWIIRALMILSGILGFCFSFVIIFQCWPISDWWGLDPTQKRCINPTVIIGLTYAVSGLNVIADWSLGILPIFVVKDLQMSKRQKKLVSGILAFAAIGSTATIVRLPYIGSLEESFAGSDGDFLYDTVGVAIWTTVEVGVGISAASLATLRPLIRLAFEKFGIGSSGNTHEQEVVAPKHRWTSRHTPDQEEFIMTTSGHQGRTTTTVTGNWNDHLRTQESKSSSQERLASPGKITTGRLTTVEYDGADMGEDEMEEDVSRPSAGSLPRRSKSTKYFVR